MFHRKATWLAGWMMLAVGSVALAEVKPLAELKTAEIQMHIGKYFDREKLSETATRLKSQLKIDPSTITYSFANDKGKMTWPLVTLSKLDEKALDTLKLEMGAELVTIFSQFQGGLLEDDEFKKLDVLLTVRNAAPKLPKPFADVTQNEARTWFANYLAESKSVLIKTASESVVTLNAMQLTITPTSKAKGAIRWTLPLKEGVASSAVLELTLTSVLVNAFNQYSPGGTGTLIIEDVEPLIAITLIPMNTPEPPMPKTEEPMVTPMPLVPVEPVAPYVPAAPTVSAPVTSCPTVHYELRQVMVMERHGKCGRCVAVCKTICVPVISTPCVPSCQPSYTMAPLPVATAEPTIVAAAPIIMSVTPVTQVVVVPEITLVKPQPMEGLTIAPTVEEMLAIQPTVSNEPIANVSIQRVTTKRRTGSATVHDSEGRRLYWEGNYADALDRLTAATEMSETNAVTWYYKGLAEQKLGQLTAGEQSLRRGADLQIAMGASARNVYEALVRVQGADRAAINEALKAARR